jgi:hypothetical protein
MQTYIDISPNNELHIVGKLVKGHSKAGCYTGLKLISDCVQQRVAAADMKSRAVYCRVLHHQPGVKATAR